MGKENKNISILNPSSHLAEAYKKLQVNIQIASMNSKVQVIQITSSESGEGKTFTAVNLASVYSAKNKKVIIVDLDFRKPKVHKAFNIENKLGVVDILLNNASLEDTIQHCEYDVDVLTRGSKVDNIELLLESEGLDSLIKTLREQYEIIILDCPPAMVVTDASIITRLADGLVFVVAYNHSKKDIVKEAVKRIKLTGVKVLGAVLSQVENSPRRSYYAGYQYYYYGSYGSYHETNTNEGGNE